MRLSEEYRLVARVLTDVRQRERYEHVADLLEEIEADADLAGCPLLPSGEGLSP